MINTDWKKIAAQVLDEKEVERAFMDQAYNFVSNKAGPLMEDPHRLGFEVVYSDEDHTRMVGIFAFRVNKELLYVPTFFLNGQIRGTDLLYCHDSKMFRPLNKDWATYLVEKQKDDMGQGISQQDTRRMPMDVELEDIAYPPAAYTYKSAGVREMFEKLANSFSESMDADVKSMVSKLIDEKHCTDNEKPVDAKVKEIKDKREEETPKPEEDNIESGNVKKASRDSVLKEFILNDGGPEAVEKIASWMRTDKKFAELVVTQLSPEAYMPPELIEQVKSASVAAPPEPQLMLYTGGLEAFAQQPRGDMTKMASAQDEFFSKGYYLWDDRAPGDLNPTTQDLNIELCRPGEAGVYKVLCADGTLKEAILAAPIDQRFDRNGTNRSYMTHPDAWCDQWDRDKPRKLVAVLKDTGESGECRNVHGEFVKTMADCIRDEELETDMKRGKSYRVFDAESGTLSEPVHCFNRRTKNDIVVYTVCAEGWGDKFELRQNKDQDNSSFGANFLGNAVFFIPVTTRKSVAREDDEHQFYAKELPDMGDEKTLTQWILSHGVKEASLHRDKVDPTLFSLRAGPRKQTNYMPRPALAAKMARDLCIHADEVEFFMDKAAAEGYVRFFIGAPGIEKFAAPIQLMEQEQFRQDHDPQFNVGLDYPQAFALSTQTAGIAPPEQRIGDAYDPGMGMTAEDGQSLSAETVMNAPAEQLGQLREQAGVPNVFEHGLIGSLIHTYDSVAMIDKYVPDLEKALDRLGRLLFLYYWKPRDFEDAYGADDMSNMENQLLSTFQSFGELVLELLKKSQTKGRPQGNVSMFSN